MFYEFQKEDGEIITRQFRMGECPWEIVCEDGQKAKRIYSIPNISVKGSRSSSEKASDERKRRAEVLHEAKEVGMENFIPTKGQNASQQLRDLKENRSQFRDQMSRSNEEHLKKQAQKMKEVSEANRRKITPETYLKRQEAKQKREAEKRAISL